MIADLAGDRTTFAPGTAEFIDNDPTLAGIGVFSDPISGYLLITPVNGTADGSFSLADKATTASPATTPLTAALANRSNIP